MALTKLTVSHHNLKRAEALKNYGINTLDLPSAKPSFKGYGAGTCELCGQKNLKWLFQLHFDEPQALLALAKIDCEIDRDSEVTITPVGSKCITDWIDALPETLEKLELLKRWDVEMRKAKSAMKAKVVEDLCEAAGFDAPYEAFESFCQELGQGPRYYERYSRACQAVSRYDIAMLIRNAYKVKNMTLSRKTCQDWLKLLLKIKALPPLPEVDVEAERQKAEADRQAAETTKVDVQKILDDGMALYNLHHDKLSDYYRSAFLDIHSKVSKWGDFKSEPRKKFFTDMVRKLEA